MKVLEIKKLKSLNGSPRRDDLEQSSPTFPEGEREGKWGRFCGRTVARASKAESTLDPHVNEAPSA